MNDYNSAKTRVQNALTALKAGRAIILMDDIDRENEADLIIAAEKITTPLMALFIRECSGIVCLCLDEEKLQTLNLPQMVEHNHSHYQTPFTVSIEAKEGVSTGVSAADRVTTIRAAINPQAKPDDLVSPGHMFPLRASKGGVLKRRGHTEGSVDLCLMAGFSAAAVLCELMNPDGTMMRGDALEQFSKTHNFPIVSIEDIVQIKKAP